MVTLAAARAAAGGFLLWLAAEDRRFSGHLPRPELVGPSIRCAGATLVGSQWR